MFWFAIVTYWAVGANLCAAVPQPQTSGLETVAKPQPSELKIASMLLYATVSRGVEVLSFTVNETTSRDDGSVGRNKVHRQHFCDAATSTDTVLNNVIESNCVELGTAIEGELSFEKVKVSRNSQDYQQPLNPLLFRLTTVNPPLGFQLEFRFDNAGTPWSKEINTVEKEWNCDRTYEQAVCIWKGAEEKRFVE